MNPEVVSRLFDLIDRDQSGTITTSEILNAVTKSAEVQRVVSEEAHLGSLLNGGAWEHCYQAMDSDGDGQISLDEFQRFCNFIIEERRGHVPNDHRRWSTLMQIGFGGGDDDDDNRDNNAGSERRDGRDKKSLDALIDTHQSGHGAKRRVRRGSVAGGGGGGTRRVSHSKSSGASPAVGRKKSRGHDAGGGGGRRRRRSSIAGSTPSSSSSSSAGGHRHGGGGAGGNSALSSSSAPRRSQTMPSRRK